MSGSTLRLDGGTFKMEEPVERYASLLEVSEGYERRPRARGTLDERYQKIGISAVAAAVRYQGDAEPAANVRKGEQAKTKPRA